MDDYLHLTGPATFDASDVSIEGACGICEILTQRPVAEFPWNDVDRCEFLRQVQDLQNEFIWNEFSHTGVIEVAKRRYDTAEILPQFNDYPHLALREQLQQSASQLGENISCVDAHGLQVVDTEG